MIKKLSVQNFKSIKDLQLNCKRVNLFIGEPNVGKSNILEALGLPAVFCTLTFEGLIRLHDLSNLFFENDPSNKVSVIADEIRTEVSYEFGKVYLKLFKNSVRERELSSAFANQSFGMQSPSDDFGIHPYHFKVLTNFPQLYSESLSIPHGNNLFFLLQTNRGLRNLVSEIIQERGYKLTLRQANNEIEISKEEDSILTAYPYAIISDTLQRIIFYSAAIGTAKDGDTLIFEEPESNVFPYYTKYLAEKISLDDTKQYFITTHNHYFLQSIIQKTPVSQLQVNVVSMKHFKTFVRPIVLQSEIEELIDMDSSVFLNLDKFLSE
ncbi:MAG: AAA family ATPase [Bacteroidota bacterium]